MYLYFEINGLTKNYDINNNQEKIKYAWTL